MASGKGRGEPEEEIHVSSGGVRSDDDRENKRPLLPRPPAQAECYSVSAAILPFFFPALGGLLYGYDIGATSSPTISIKAPQYCISCACFHNKNAESLVPHRLNRYDILMSFSSISLCSQRHSVVHLGTICHLCKLASVVSGSLYGALIGSVLAFTIADFLGQRKELILASISYLIEALLTAAAPNFPIMVVGRFLYGIGIGLAMHAAPMYIAETAPSQIRGMLISLKLFIVLGMLLGYIAGNSYVEVVSGWRYMYATRTPLCFIMGVRMCWLPSSPRWLLLCAIKGKGNLPETKENATRCLCRLRGQPSPDLVSDHINLIQEKQVGSIEIFQEKSLKAMIIGCGLVFFQQVIFYVFHPSCITLLLLTNSMICVTDRNPYA